MKKQELTIAEAVNRYWEFWGELALAADRWLMAEICRNTGDGECEQCGSERTKSMYLYSPPDGLKEIQERHCYDCSYEQRLGVD